MHINHYGLSMAMNDISDVNRKVERLEKRVETLERILAAHPERTVKVEDIQVEWGDDEYVNDRLGAMYHYGNCGNCGETVSHNQKYCHECGGKLEWE